MDDYAGRSEGPPIHASDRGLRDFWAVYDAHYDATLAETLRVALEHREFRAIVAALSPEQLAAQNRESHERLRRAVEGDWSAYDVQLREQGVAYGRMGVAFESWYDLTRAFQRSLVPRLVERFGDEPERLANALSAMMDFLDRAMTIIARAYLETKAALIHEQREIAEQRAQELAASAAAQRRQAQELESVLHSMRDALVMCDEEGRIRVANRAAERLLGVGLVGERVEDLPARVGLRHADGARTVAPDGSPLALAVRGVCTNDVELRLHSDDAREDRVLSVDGRPLLGDDGSLQGGLVVLRDVSERKRIEAIRQRSVELEAESRRIQEASRLKSEFLANMSHELRTPLNAIIGFAELMHDGTVGPVSPQHEEFLGDILASGRHLLQLINDILDLAKVEAGRLEFRPEPVNLARVVGEVVATLRPLAEARALRIETAVDPVLAGVVLDPARLKQVLYNFLSNALKFTPRAGRVTVRATPDGAQDFRLAVEDTGPGIAPEDLQRLFVEFQQLDRGASKKHSGTGLGLALTRRLVEAQGGTVGVRSVPGEGSTFHAVLPRVAPSHAPSAHPASVSGRRPGAPVILVVEDDVHDQRLLVDALASAGYAVETAMTGTAALQRCRERRFDAITLDLLLPETSGLEVLREIRTGTLNRDVPVVVVSVVAERGAVAGFAVHDFLPKPVDGRALLASLALAGLSPEAPGAVLVVDDDPGSLKLMEVTLSQIGFPALIRQDGDGALRAAETFLPIAVVLDLLMPGMNGFEFLDRFRALPAHRRTPVIVWTVKDLTAQESARLRASAQAVVQKGRGGAWAVLDALQAHLPLPPPEAPHGR